MSVFEWDTVPKIPSLSNVKQVKQTAKVSEKSEPKHEKKTNSYTWTREKERLSVLTDLDKKMIEKQNLKMFVAIELKTQWANRIGSTTAAKILKEKGIYYASLRSVKKYYSIFYMNIL